MIWYLQAFLPALVATVFVIVRLKAAVRGERQAPLEHKAVSDALALKAMADGDCETNPKIANPTADDEETAMLRHEKAGRTLCCWTKRASSSRSATIRCIRCKARSIKRSEKP